MAADRRGRWAQEYPAMAPLRALADAELAQEQGGDDNLLVGSLGWGRPGAGASRQGGWQPVAPR